RRRRRAAVLADGLSNSVAAGTAVTNGVTAFVLLLATAAVIDRLHAMMVREASRARFDSLTGLPNRRACDDPCALQTAPLRRRLRPPPAAERVAVGRVPGFRRAEAGQRRQGSRGR